ncbi:MAG: SpoIIE family protein phosphatase [Planctomycetota bacterium]
MFETSHRFVEWGVAARPFPGEQASGDRCAVVPREDGVLVAVIDALGHGVAAEWTARRVSRILEQHAREPLPILIDRCHRALMGDRGAVLSVAVIDGPRSTMTWAGVGNIAGFVLPARDTDHRRQERLITPPGIVGGQLPALKAASVTLATGDLVLLATDGLRDGFAEGILPDRGDPQRLAEQVILDHATEADDALVLVVRFLGGS